MEAIPLPNFTFLLMGAAGGALILSGLLLFTFRGNAADAALPAALVPFLIPVCATALTLMMISVVGASLLTVGKQVAVPLALGLALAVLLVCSALSANVTESQER